MSNRHQLQVIFDYVEQQGLSEQTLLELREQYKGALMTTSTSRIPTLKDRGLTCFWWIPVIIARP